MIEDGVTFRDKYSETRPLWEVGDTIDFLGEHKVVDDLYYNAGLRTWVTVIDGEALIYGAPAGVRKVERPVSDKFPVGTRVRRTDFDGERYGTVVEMHYEKGLGERRLVRWDPDPDEPGDGFEGRQRVPVGLPNAGASEWVPVTALTDRRVPYRYCPEDNGRVRPHDWRMDAQYCRTCGHVAPLDRSPAEQLDHEVAAIAKLQAGDLDEHDLAQGPDLTAASLLESFRSVLIRGCASFVAGLSRDEQMEFYFELASAMERES